MVTNVGKGMNVANLRFFSCTFSRPPSFGTFPWSSNFGCFLGSFLHYFLFMKSSSYSFRFINSLPGLNLRMFFPTWKKNSKNLGEEKR